jgi:formylmethanofuran dehydrogenase subunit B
MSGPATCLGCGCACDDIELEISRNQITAARNACSLGIDWFGRGPAPSRALVGAREAPLDDALGAIADLLTRHAHPAVYLAPELSCEAQQAAIALADGLRATLDTITSGAAGGATIAAAAKGWASATLGEVRNRADLVVFWAVDPSIAYPRFLTRYAPEPAGVHVPHGRRSRTVIAVDIADRRGPLDADIHVTVAPDDELDVLISLRAAAADPGARGHGVSWKLAQALSVRLLQGRYIVFVADGEQMDARRLAYAEALIVCVQAFNERSRAALTLLRGGGNRSGADVVAASQTGFSTAVDFSRGYPRSALEGRTLASRCDRGEIDALLIVGDPRYVEPSLRDLGRSVPYAVIGPYASADATASPVATIDTGIPGIHSTGTAARMDEVLLPLDSHVGGPPNTADVIAALTARCLDGAKR